MANYCEVKWLWVSDDILLDHTHRGTGRYKKVKDYIVRKCNEYYTIMQRENDAPDSYSRVPGTRRFRSREEALEYVKAHLQK